ncbi:unnamed protein product [Thelazia callipaeda]|uniref:TGF_BETA_2 domain-containing protein n=1 Tax=Thelazia callipaeda TaxID=103827 RepID=A0A0N5CXH8_THECL|nr:unnamed protein product [Thelazia callipaeda]
MNDIIFFDTVLLSSLLYIGFSTSTVLQPTKEQIAILQTTFKNLLDLEHLPSNARQPALRIENAASKYMRRLFNQYNADINDQNNLHGNIIRSINPTVEILFGEELLIFKLNRIKPTEQIVRAELHYNIHPKHRSVWKHVKNIVKAHAFLQNNGKKQTVQLNPSSASDFLLNFDMTELVLKAISANQSIIAVKFLRNGKKMKCSGMFKHNTPFLLVYTKESFLINAINHSFKISADAFHQLSSGLKKRSKRMSPYYEYSAKEKQDANDSSNTWEAQSVQQLKTYRELGPRILRDRKQDRRLQMRKQKKIRGAFRNDPMMGFGVKKKFTKIITPSPSSVVQEKAEDVTLVLLPGQTFSSQSCRKQKLNVRFRDIGWEHWIIAPTSFEAHYCSGTCPFPLRKEMNPSNHAIVQSIIYQLGLNPDIPNVCCAPDKMDSLSLLYYDEVDNVVLKNYPRMTVTSCACL